MKNIFDMKEYCYDSFFKKGAKDENCNYDRDDVGSGGRSALWHRRRAAPPIPAQEQPEVLTRGPVHEAFAEPVNLQVQAGLVAPNQPPANIEEIPPAERPQGDQYVWVPGYWSWDADRNNYIWVSGCWRAAPPNMYWVPGYWSQVSRGWEWVAGFWATGRRSGNRVSAGPAGIR